MFETPNHINATRGTLFHTRVIITRAALTLCRINKSRSNRLPHFGAEPTRRISTLLSRNVVTVVLLNNTRMFGK